MDFAFDKEPFLRENNQLPLSPMLRNFRVLDNKAVVTALVVEPLTLYLAIADGFQVKAEEAEVEWWARRAVTLPNWSSTASRAIQVQPSFAST